MQKMAIRILASDLDGTLLNEESRISAKTAKAVKRAQKAGIRFIAVTGRAWNTAHPIFQEAEIKADYILLNGAEFRTSSGAIMYQETIEKNLAEKIVNYLSTTGIDFEVNTNKGDFSTDTKVCQTALEIQDFEKIWNQNPKILKFFIFSDQSIVIEKVKKYLKDWQGISVTSSAAWNVEITAKAAEKGRMLKRAAQFYQSSEDEVMVFGDGENDETMFREFRHSRAVGNAVPVIRKIAEKVIESNRKNGVAKEINQIIGGLQDGIF